MQPRSTGAGPTEAELAATLGAARTAWSAVVEALAAAHAPLAAEWKPSKSGFGWLCRLRQKDRTLVYLTPEAGSVLAAVVLGERAVEAALASDLPAAIKELITAARAYAEGRGIRFRVRSQREVRVVVDLVAIKTAPAARSKRR